MTRQKRFLLVVAGVLLVCLSMGFVTLRHFVQSGDSFSGVASKYSLSLSILLDWNPEFRGKVVQQGDVLRIPFPAGILYIVQPGDTLSSICATFFCQTLDIARDLSLSPPYTLRVGQELFFNLRLVGKRFADEPFKLLWPVYGEISSPYGWRTHPISGERDFHGAIDIAASQGSPIFAPDSGTITRAGTNGGYGLMIEMDTARYTLRFGHLSQIDVVEGQVVERGQLIGRVGSTGSSTGPHVHFEVRDVKTGDTMDPVPFLPAKMIQ
ncbi:MAG TPA: M23 family metallopeptidase [Thermotogota bacterium]|nr:M23 family metallopeptidase [Thermotogota bacterium]HRW92874.1 M23 family metallopeptidase [Thermotogota bacterium]